VSAPGRTRTFDREIKSLPLYQLSYGGPSTSSFAGDSATAVARWRQLLRSGERLSAMAVRTADLALVHLDLVRLWRQPGGLARPIGVGKGLDADDPPIADGQERGSGLIDFELVRPADDVHDDRYLITGVVEPQRLNSVRLPSRQELTPEAPYAVKASVTVDGKQ
jgi:hypothetical protein